MKVVGLPCTKAELRRCKDFFIKVDGGNLFYSNRSGCRIFINKVKLDSLIKFNQEDYNNIRITSFARKQLFISVTDGLEIFSCATSGHLDYDAG